MKRLIILFAATLLLLSTQAAHANILGDSCIALDDAENFQTASSLYALPLGLRCEDIRTINEMKAVVSIGIGALWATVQNPAVQASLAPELAALGITPAGAAIATVTIVGGLGVHTLNFVLKKGLDECAQMDREALKQEILREIDARYGAKASTQTSIQIVY